jgi:hypothetical protein
VLYCLTVELELARQQWQDGARRVAGNRRLLEQVDHVVAALRQRVGQVFTMQELADQYDRADDWARDVVDDAFPDDPPAEAGTVADAAFDVYSRGASDYRP